MQNHFLKNWNFNVNEEFLTKVKNYFENNNCPTLGDLSFKNYQEGIKINKQIFENGLYIFKFSNSFYVGKATSCTIIERLAKHFDSRKVGSFNGLLKKLSSENLTENNYPENQEILMNAKLLILPINNEELIKQNASCNSDSCINDLEMDLIIMLGNILKLPTKNTKTKKVLSGSYF
jgi:hypothetical protein